MLKPIDFDGDIDKVQLSETINNQRCHLDWGWNAYEPDAKLKAQIRIKPTNLS